VRLLLTVGSRCIAFGRRDAAFEKAWQNFLKSYSGFVQCRQGALDLAAGKRVDFINSTVSPKVNTGASGCSGLIVGCLPREWWYKRLRAASFGPVRGAAKLGHFFGC